MTIHSTSAPSTPGGAPAAGFGSGCGLLVVGHGTADPVGADETRAVAAALAELLPSVPVELGFLEVIGPSIDDALRRLADRGCRDVVAAPLLLFAAGHAKRDVPEALDAAARASGQRVVQAEPLGCHADVLAVSQERRRQAVAGLPAVAASATDLLVVGRGSSDPEALRQLGEFAEGTLAGDAARPRRLLLAFVAAARPSLDEAVEEACDPAAGDVRRIIVQPHLLFRGHVEQQVAAAVARGRAARPDVEWVQVPRLGPDRLVARALASRAAAARARESMSRQG